jgi:hypothetical protein
MFTYRQSDDPRTGEKVDEYHDAAKNPPGGALVQYFLKLKDKPEEDISLTFLHADGTEIRTYSSKNPEADKEEGVDVARASESAPEKPKEPRIPKEPGLNRFVWNLRYPDATRLENDDTGNEMVQGAISGPTVPPGRYRVRLQVGEQTFEQEFDVRKDPRVAATEADLKSQFELLLRLRDRLSETHTAINELRAVCRRASDYVARSKDHPELESVARSAQAVLDRLRPIEEELIQARAKSRGDWLNFPIRLNGKLAALARSISSADGPPTSSARAVFDDLSRRIQVQLDQLAESMVTEVGTLNEEIHKAKLPPVGV